MSLTIDVVFRTADGSDLPVQTKQIIEEWAKKYHIFENLDIEPNKIYFHETIYMGWYEDCKKMMDDVAKSAEGLIYEYSSFACRYSVKTISISKNGKWEEVETVSFMDWETDGTTSEAEDMAWEMSKPVMSE